MFNLALLLADGGNGLVKDGERAISLYERAIDEARDVASMYFLEKPLGEGGNGVTQDIERAMGLYQ